MGLRGRDLPRAHGGQWLKGKSIDATMPLGPWITMAHEIADVAGLRITCELNGRLMQDASAADMAFPIPRVVAELQPRHDAARRGRDPDRNS